MALDLECRCVNACDIVVGIDQVLIGQNKDRYLVFVGQIEGPCRQMERLLKIPGGEDNAWKFPVSRIERQFQITLFRSRRQTCCRTGSLRQVDHQRRFNGPCEAHTLGHQGESSPRCRYHPACPGIPCPDCHVYRRYFVLCLFGNYPEFLRLSGKKAQDRGGGCHGVGSDEITPARDRTDTHRLPAVDGDLIVHAGVRMDINRYDPGLSEIFSDLIAALDRADIVRCHGFIQIRKPFLQVIDDILHANAEERSDYSGHDAVNVYFPSNI